MNDNSTTYGVSFGVEHIPKGIKMFNGNKSIITNIYIIQAYDLIMCRYFSIRLLILCSKAKLW